MAKKRTKKRVGRGLSGAEASVKHLSREAYEQLLRREGIPPLARGACRPVRVKVTGGKPAQLCRLPTGPVLIVGRSAGPSASLAGAARKGWQVPLYQTLPSGKAGKHTFDILGPYGTKREANIAKKNHSGDRRFVPVVERERPRI